MTGDLTIRSIIKTVDLHISFGGIAKDPYGNDKTGFELTGRVSRKEFGLAWNAITEAGGVVVADEVKFLLNVELTRQ